MGRKRTLYMAVTPDEYELPMCVGTASEVAKFGECSTDVLYSSIYHRRDGRKKGCKFVKVGNLED